MTDGRKRRESQTSRERMPVRYLWASIYGYHHRSDPYREPPGRKGSREEKADDGDKAVFTGRPASAMTPLMSDKGCERVGSAVRVRRLLAKGVSRRCHRVMVVGK